MAGGGGLSGHVNEADADGHSLGQPGVQCTDLRMNVGQKGESRPTPDLHDRGVLHALELERHGTGCAKGMSTNPCKVVSLGKKIGVLDGLVDQGRDMGRGDVTSRLHKAEWR